MAIQIAVGTEVLLTNIVMAAVAAMGMKLVFQRSQGWLLRDPHRPRLVLVLAGFGFGHRDDHLRPSDLPLGQRGRQLRLGQIEKRRKRPG